MGDGREFAGYDRQAVCKGQLQSCQTAGRAGRFVANPLRSEISKYSLEFSSKKNFCDLRNNFKVRFSLFLLVAWKQSHMQDAPPFFD